MDRGDWWPTVHRAAKSQTRLKRLSTHARPKQSLKDVSDCVSTFICLCSHTLSIARFIKESVSVSLCCL